MRELSNTEFEIKADIVFLAMGFVHAEHDLVKRLGLNTDSRGNIAVDADYMTNVAGIFAAGDSSCGLRLSFGLFHREAGSGRDRQISEFFIKLFCQGPCINRLG